jgi:hypothetical protein
VGERAVRDPALGAGDAPAVTVPLGVGAQGADVASRIRLGEAEAADGAAGRQLRQPAFLLVMPAQP